MPNPTVTEHPQYTPLSVSTRLCPDRSDLQHQNQREPTTHHAPRMGSFVYLQYNYRRADHSVRAQSKA